MRSRTETAAKRLLCVLPSLAGGGAERACVNLCNALVRNGWDVTLATVHGAGPLAGLPDTAIARRDLGARRVLGALPALVSLVRELRPPVLLSTPAHLNLAVLALRPLFGVRRLRICVREANMPSATLPRQPLPWLFTRACRWLYRRADAVVCPARRVADELASVLHVARTRIGVLPNPVDFEALARARAAPRRAPGDGLRLVAAGRLTWQKGFDRLIGCFDGLAADAELDIFGEGPERVRLERAIAASGCAGRIRLRGFCDDPWPWFAGADALVVPSRWEGMPNVALEALGCGTPVVALASAGGIAELEPLEPGALTVVGDEAGLLDALARLAVARPARRALLSGLHDCDAVARRFEALLGAVA